MVEHAICRIKKYRIMNDVFRNRLGKYNKASDIVTGLINYRIIEYQLDYYKSTIVKRQC